jgi:putative hydrolase of the HAD superfamily
VSDITYLLRNDPPRAVLFDYFGTLTRAVRRGPAHQRMARRLGCDPDEWLDLMEKTYYLRASGRLGEPAEVLHDLARLLGGRPSRGAVRRVCSERISAVGADGPLRPESVPVLQALCAGGLRTAVVSDCWYELPALLPSLPVHPLLDAHVFSIEVGRCKPHPSMYLTACERLGVAPHECLYIGDGGSEELSGAMRLGLRAVRLAAPDLVDHLVFRRDEAFAGLSIASLTEVVPLVDVLRTGSDGDLELLGARIVA